MAAVRIFMCAMLLGGYVNASEVRPLRVSGLVAAVFSPFEEKSGGLNISRVNQQYTYLKETGVEWAFVGGTTGESLSLSKNERMELTEAWIQTGMNVIVHVGSECLQDAKDLAKHAKASGAHAIATMPPVFFSPANAQALALTVAEICGATPSLPCYYYHIPSMSKYAQPMLDFVKAIAPLSENFVGIKYTGLYTNPGFMDAERVMNWDNGKSFGHYEVLGGREEMMLEALAVGITGFVGSQFNFAGDLFNRLYNRFQTSGLTSESMKEIRGLQLAGVDLIGAWQVAPTGVNGGKVFMNLAGVGVGPARLPSLPVDESTTKALHDSLCRYCTEHIDLDLAVCKAPCPSVRSAL
eukprot:g2983.t1